MRPNVRAFVEQAAKSWPLRGPIYEFGSYLVEGQNGLGDLRPIFRGERFVGCDMRPGPGVMRFEPAGGGVKRSGLDAEAHFRVQATVADVLDVAVVSELTGRTVFRFRVAVRALVSSVIQRPAGIWPALATVAATRAIWNGDATTCPCP